MTHPETTPATPEGDAISRAAIDAAKEDHLAEARQAWEDSGDEELDHGHHMYLAGIRDFANRLRSLPPQDGERGSLDRHYMQVRVKQQRKELRRMEAVQRGLERARDGLMARAEKAEARVAELEAENERIGNLFDNLCHFTTPEQRRAYLTGEPAALTAQPVAQEPVAWQWRARIKGGGAWDAWEMGRYLRPVPPFMDFEERPLYAHPATPAPVEAAMIRDAARYRWLRERDVDAIDKGGVFAGMTPQNVVLSLEDLDAAVDAARAQSAPVGGEVKG